MITKDWYLEHYTAVDHEYARAYQAMQEISDTDIDEERRTWGSETATSFSNRTRVRLAWRDALADAFPVVCSDLAVE